VPQTDPRASARPDAPARFHQSITFLPTRQAVPLARASDELGYGGIYISDHLFNPRSLESRYTYSVREDGAPGWESETPWPDPMCVISALSSVTEQLLFTTGVYIAPARDLITVAKSVGTTAVLSDNRVRLGVGVLRIQADRIAKLLRGPAEVALRSHRTSQVVVRVGVVGLRREQALVRRDGR